MDYEEGETAERAGKSGDNDFDFFVVSILIVRQIGHMDQSNRLRNCANNGFQLQGLPLSYL